MAASANNNGRSSRRQVHVDWLWIFCFASVIWCLNCSV